MNQYDFSVTTYRFEQALEKIDFENLRDVSFILNALPNIRLKEGYKLGACRVGTVNQTTLHFYALKDGSSEKYVPGEIGVHLNPDPYTFGRYSDPVPIPFKDGQYIEGIISLKAFETIPHIEDYLDVELSVECVWEAVLLLDAAFGYLNIWHKCELIVNSLSLVRKCDGLSVEGWEEFLQDPRIVPSIIVIPEQGAIIRYCRWSDQDGLTNIVLKADYSNRTLHFERIGSETLFEYDWGIRF